MKKYIKYIFVFSFLIASVSLFAETNQSDPKQSVYTMMDSMKNYKQAPKHGKLSAASISNNLELDARIRAVFNYPNLIQGSLSIYWKKLKPAQQTNLLIKLRRVIELTAYPRGGYYFKEARVDIGNPSLSGKIASVPVDFTLKGTVLKSVFQLKDEGKGYQVIDYILGGKSLIQLYRGQFSHIIQKKGLSYFIKKVEARYKLLTSLYSK